MKTTQVEAKQEIRQAYETPKLDYQGQWETVVGYSNTNGCSLDCK